MSAPAVPLMLLFELAGQGSVVAHAAVNGIPLCGLSRPDLSATVPRDRRGRERDWFRCGECLAGVVRP